MCVFFYWLIHGVSQVLYEKNGKTGSTIEEASEMNHLEASYWNSCIFIYNSRLLLLFLLLQGRTFWENGGKRE